MIGQPRACALRIVAALSVIAIVAACSGAPAAGGPTLQPAAPADTSQPAAPTVQPARVTASTVPAVSPAPTAAAKPTPTAKAKPTGAPTAGSVKSPPPTSKPTDSLATTGRIVVTEQGFALTLPTGWRRIPLDGSALGELSKVLPADSDIGRLLSSQVGQAALAGIKLWAFDLRPASLKNGYAPNLNAVVEPATKGLGLSAFKEFLVAQLKSVNGISSVDSAILTIPSGQAIRTTYRISIPLASGLSIHVSGIQFVLLGSAHTYAITYACPVGDTVCSKAADASIRTFAFVN